MSWRSGDRAVVYDDSPMRGRAGKIDAIDSASGHVVMEMDPQGMDNGPGPVHVTGEDSLRAIESVEIPV